MDTKFRIKLSPFHIYPQFKVRPILDRIVSRPCLGARYLVQLDAIRSHTPIQNTSGMLTIQSCFAITPPRLSRVQRLLLLIWIPRLSAFIDEVVRFRSHYPPIHASARPIFNGDPNVPTDTLTRDNFLWYSPQSLHRCSVRLCISL